MWGLLARCKTPALLIAAVALSCPTTAASEQATARVRILRPLTLINEGPLSFGRILTSATAGTVTIDSTNGARTTTGGATALGGTVSAAIFTGWSEGPTHVKIDLPNGSIPITHTDGVTTMVVEQFTTNVTKNNWLPPDEIFSFNVGARLRVNANQKPGVYSGQFNVTVIYR